MVFIRYYFDSLNPSAIAQQMLLQAMVKRSAIFGFYLWHWNSKFDNGPCHLLRNCYMGIKISYENRQCVSAVCVWGGGNRRYRPFGGWNPAYHQDKTKQRWKNNNGCEETENVKAPAQLSPVSLFIMGAAFCMVELTSAFPYFGFLALLTSYHLIFPLALLFMLIYNFMYMLPLILLYFGYNKLQGTTTIKN